MSEPKSVSYKIPQHPQVAGWLMGLSGAQWLVGGFGALVAIDLLDSFGLLGVPLVALDILAVVMVAFRRLHGRTLVEWGPVMIRYAVAKSGGTLEFQRTRQGHVTRVPSGPFYAPEPMVPPVSLPVELASVQILEARLDRFGGIPLGVAFDRAANTYTTCVKARPTAFYLLSSEQQRDLLEAWGAVITSFGEDSPVIDRVQWGVRRLPPRADELVDYIRSHTREGIAEDDVSLQATQALVDAQGNARIDHEVFVAIRMSAHRTGAASAIKAHGGKQRGALAVIADRTGHLIDELTRIGVMSQQAIGAQNPAVMSPRTLAAMLRNGLDPFNEPEVAQAPAGMEPGVDPAMFGPFARRAGWGYYCADSTVHIAGNVTEMPRDDFRATFLGPLLNGHWGPGVVSCCMAVVPPEKARRTVQTARVKDEGDKHVRHKYGSMTSARTRKREADVVRLEEELASGHELVTFTVHVAVSVPEERGLGEAHRRFQQAQVAARKSGLRLHAAYGDQLNAITFTLPLCRGLR